MDLRFCPACAAPLTDREEAGRIRRACSASCGWVYYDNPLPVVAALVELGGDVVLVRNQGWPESWFGLVAGFLERGESPTEGVLRELREELGLEGTVVSLIGVYPFEQMNQVILAYHVRAGGEIVAGDEIAAVKRIPADQLRPWPFGTGLAVADWLRSRGIA
jgi:NADH pyrophosphatase NudC (nudix superfamily)